MGFNIMDRMVLGIIILTLAHALLSPGWVYYALISVGIVYCLWQVYMVFLAFYYLKRMKDYMRDNDKDIDDMISEIVGEKDD